MNFVPLNALLRFQIAFWYEIDLLVSGLTGGKPGYPLSYRWGKMADRGSRTGCWLCKFLNATLGIHHCRETVDRLDAHPPKYEDATLCRVSLPLCALTALLIYLIK